MVGRSAERAALLAALERAAGGGGGLLVLIGGQGSGRTALLTWAAAQARERGLQVDVVAAHDAAATTPGDGQQRRPGRATTGPVRVVILDDADTSVRAAALLRAIDADPHPHQLVLAASATPLGLRAEVALPPLTVDEVARLAGGLAPDVARVVRAASRGLPGPALGLLAAAGQATGHQDPVVALALTASSDVAFLEVDDALVRLLEAALLRDASPADRALLLARLARELMGDATTWSRRARLLREAAALADRSEQPHVRAQVLEARLHGLWGPDAVGERAGLAAELIRLARAAGDLALERRGMFWQFVSLMEAGRVGDAQSRLRAYERAAVADAGDQVMVLGRHALIDVLRGRYDEAEALILEVAELGHRAGVPDTDRLTSTLFGQIAADRGSPADAERNLATLRAAARRMPGHFFETTVALLLLEAGRRDEAVAELHRVLPRLLAGSGQRWLGAATHAAQVAAQVGDETARNDLYDSLLPYSGRMALWGGANSCAGPVDHQLGRLALASGRPDDAVRHLIAAEAAQRAEGLLPGLARTLAALGQALHVRGDTGDAARCLGQARELADRLGLTRLSAQLERPADHWTLRRDGPDWLLDAGEERARLRDVRGLTYLAALLRAPRLEVAATVLVTGGTPVAPEAPDPLLDRQAVAAYRARLARLEAEADTADRLGDAAAAERLAAERDAVLAELRGGTGPGGRRRSFSTASERARVSVTKALGTAVDRIDAQAPRCAAHLRASLRTGHRCRYDPAPGGPAGWLT